MPALTYEAALENVITAQNAYYVIHGESFQGIATGTLPNNGGIHTPDGTKKPSDEEAPTWIEAGMEFPVDLKVMLQCDKYRTPEGIWGFIFQGWRTQDGTRLQRQTDCRWDGAAFEKYDGMDSKTRAEADAGPDEIA